MSLGWRRQRERGHRLLLATIFGIALGLGRSAARALLYPIVWYFVVFSGPSRRAARRYLARVLGRRPGPSDLIRHFYTFASIILDRVYLLTGQFHRFNITTEGLEVLAARLGEGHGCLLLGSHLGCFEVARAYGKGVGMEVKLVMHEDNAPMIRAALARLDPEAVTNVIPAGTVEAMLRVQECLARGGVVGILGDRVVNPAHVVECPFLGRPAAFPAGTFRLASLLEVPVVLFFGLYLGGNRYAIHFELLAERIDRARPDRAGAARYWTERYAERLEHYCRMAPYNWFNFYDYWGEEDAVTTRRRRARSAPGRAPAGMRRVRGSRVRRPPRG
ncbi:MAG: hypothetical protein ACREXK_06730 [Gammaproteobacteria bacterium]